jgi:hypothetical protein
MKKFVTILLFCLPGMLLGQGTRFGIGVIIGSPTGVSGTYIMGKHSGITVHAGWSLSKNFGLHITGDYQHRFPGIIKNEEGIPIHDLAPYVGIGGSMRIKTEEPEDETDVTLGARIGGGIDYFVKPVGFFLEAFPVVNVYPNTRLHVEGGLGFRFFF